MEASLVVIGVNHRTAPVEIRERFSITESRLCATLVQLGRCDGVDEVVALATSERTEFVVWAADMTRAANSVLSFLTQNYGLRLSEWSGFYRLLGTAALLHVFRVAAGLDSFGTCEVEPATQVKSAWDQARHAGTAGQHLNAIFEEALVVSEKVARETKLPSQCCGLAEAVAEIAARELGDLTKRPVLLIGTSAAAQIAGRYLSEAGAEVRVLSRSIEHANEFAQALHGTAAPMGQRWEELARVDLLVSSSACPHFLLSKEIASGIALQRAGRPLCIVDLALPRDVDPAVRNVPGMRIYDLDDVRKVASSRCDVPAEEIARGERLVQEAAKTFGEKLFVAPIEAMAAGIRSRMDEICRQELRAVVQELGTVSEDQSRALELLATRISERAAKSMAPEREKSAGAADKKVSSVLKRFFHLEQVRAIVARSQN